MSVVRVLVAALLLTTSYAYAQTQILIDELDAGFSKTGNWDTGRQAGFFGSGYWTHGSCVFCSGDVATWSFTVPVTGSYKVYAWWVAGGDRAPDAKYTVNHAAGSTPVIVDQRKSSGQGNLLGTFTFNQGTTYSVNLGAQSSGEITADAIAIVTASSSVAAFSQQATADSYTSSAFPSTNFGSVSTIRLMNGTAFEYGFVKFDLTSIPGNLTKVTLELNPQRKPFGTTTVGVYPVSDTSWAENTITWDNQPSIGASPITTITVSDTSHTVVDVTAYFAAEKAAGRNVVTIALKGITPSGSSEWYFESRGGTGTPAIVGTWATSPLASTYLVHVDHLNTPRLITDANQNVVWRNDNQEPFGDSPPDENPSGLGAFPFDLGFPGQVRNRETSTWYNYRRDGYNSAIGGYTQAEPLGVRGDINLYRYARSNPLRFIDPNGMQAFPIGGGGGVGGFGGLGGFGGRSAGGKSPNSTGDSDLDNALGIPGAGSSSPSNSSSSSSSSTKDCPCPACTPYPAGTIGYLGPHTHDHFSKYHGMNLNPHLNLFAVNQDKDCKCRWNKNWPDAVPPPPVAGWVDLNGGFPILSP